MAQDLEELRERSKRDACKSGKDKSDVGRGDCGRDYGVKFPCVVCDKGVGSNSILCEKCGGWTHEKCYGVEGGLSKVKNFVCGRCKGIKSDGVEGSDKMEIEPGISVERVDRFCYLDEMLGEEGGAELAVENGVGKAWG